MAYGINTITNKFHCPKCDMIAYSTGKTVWKDPLLKRQLECRNLRCTVKTFYTWETTVDLDKLREQLTNR